MTFRIEKIKLHNFRSYKDVLIELDSHLTILYGPNAIGKTNFIEALQLVTEGTSFRNPSWADVVNKEDDSTSARIVMSASDEQRVRDVIFEVKSNTRTLVVNDKRVRSLSVFMGVIPSVLFTPDDLLIVSGSSEARRAELDSLGSKLSKKYFQLKQEYKKIVAQRNKLFKDEEINFLLFEVLNEQLIEYGSALIFQRIKLLKRINLEIQEAYSQINNRESLNILYFSNIFSQSQEGLNIDDEIFQTSLIEIKELFKKKLEQRKNDEFIRRISLVGPHRDDIIFNLDNSNARTFASQGQKRSITLAWKMAEVKVIEKISGSKPLLLLDDVMSELDGERRNSLTHLVSEVAQTVITTANIGYFTQDLLDQAKVINVEELIS